MLYRQLNALLGWVIKGSSLIITIPATVIVAGNLFDDITNPVLALAIRVAAVSLVEGVFMASWLLLENDKDAPPAIKTRYALTSLLMYAVLAVIGWQHEGPAGIVFRLALLAALVGAGWDTYVDTLHRMNLSIDSSAANAPKVRRNARRKDIAEAILQRNAEHQITLKNIAHFTTHSIHRGDLNHDTDMRALNLEHERKVAMLERAAQPVALPESVPSAPVLTAPAPKPRARRKPNLAALSSGSGYNMAELAEVLGISVVEAEAFVRSLVAQGKLIERGGLYYYTSPEER